MKREGFHHRKVRRLARLLREHGVAQHALPLARGICEGLWYMTATEAPHGDVGRIPDEELADHIGWDGDPADLIDVLVEAELVDRDPAHRLVTHDWADHADKHVHRRVTRSGRPFVNGRAPRISEGTPEERKLWDDGDPEPPIRGPRRGDDGDPESPIRGSRNPDPGSSLSEERRAKSQRERDAVVRGPRRGPQTGPPAAAGSSLSVFDVEDLDPEEYAPAGYRPEARRAWFVVHLRRARLELAGVGSRKNLRREIQQKLLAWAHAEREPESKYLPTTKAVPPAAPSLEAQHEAVRLIEGLGWTTDPAQLAREIETVRRQSGEPIQALEAIHQALLEGDGFGDLRHTLVAGAQYADVFREVIRRRNREEVAASKAARAQLSLIRGA